MLRCLHAVDATRVHQRRRWVVFFSSLRPFGHRDAPRRCHAIREDGLGINFPTSLREGVQGLPRHGSGSIFCQISKLEDVPGLEEGALAASRAVPSTRGHRTMPGVDRFDGNAPRRSSRGARSAPRRRSSKRSCSSSRLPCGMLYSRSKVYAKTR